MCLRKHQELIRELYIHYDRRRGFQKSYQWFLSEVYELSKAVEDGDTRDIEGEIADVMAWLLTLANLLDIDMENAFTSKYGGNCPKCGEKPCRCTYRDEPNLKVRIVEV